MDDRHALRELLLNDHGEQVVLALQEEPPAATQRLMAALGVRVEVRPDGLAANRHDIEGEPVSWGHDTTQERTKAGTLSASEMDRRHQVFLDAQPMTVGCAFHGCDWPGFTGTTAEAQAALTEHRATHPATKRRPSQKESAAAAEVAAAERRRSLDALEAMDAGLPQSRIERVNGHTPIVTGPGRKPDGSTWSRKTVTRDEAVAGLTSALTELGNVPTKSGWTKLHRSPSAATLDRIFGGWDEAVRACGFVPPEHRMVKSWTESEITEAVRAWAIVHGKPPSARDWKLAGPDRPTEDKVARVFGNWAAAIEAAGFNRPIAGHTMLGRAAARHEPVEETLAPPGINTASRELEAAPTAVSVEDAARPDELPADELQRIQADGKKVDEYLASLEVAKQEAPPEALEWDEPLELATITHGTFSLALTGDFTKDAARVRAEASLLRSQAEALDVIAGGIDQLAATVTT